MWRGMTLAALIIVGFLFAFGKISQTFDGDFGWQLRFGQEAWQGNFPYTDTYTWGYYGQTWVNHEWGGSILWWLLYNYVNYNAIIFLAAAGIWAAFIFAPRIFLPKLTIASLIISLIGLRSVSFLFGPRLTILAPLFFVLFWWSLEKVTEKKWVYLWPGLFWLWAALHGSWILGFIVLGIYIFGNLLQLILNKKFPNYFVPAGWKGKNFKKVILWGIISFLVTGLNPYQWKLWREVGHYFTEGYYKHYISEWLPSYAYPVYWFPLVLASLGAVLLYLGWRNKRVTLPRIGLFVGLFISAFQYKRNTIYLIIICLPLLCLAEQRLREVILQWRTNFFSRPTVRRCSLLLGTILIFYVGVVSVMAIHWTNDPWSDQYLIMSNAFPWGAFQFLWPVAKKEKVYLFNQFHWGGYFNWALPEALVYFDGRGTATWRYNNKESAYEHYRAIKYKPGGLQELEKTPVNYILLQNNFSGYQPADWLNQQTFSSADLQKIFATEPVQLERSLRASTRWQQVYSDSLATVWRRK